LRWLRGLAWLCTFVSVAGAATITYKYDALGRVTFVTDTVNGNRDYDYDKAGNRLLVTTGGASDTTNEPGIAIPLAPSSATTTLVSFCNWRADWSSVTGATRYDTIDSAGTIRSTTGLFMSLAWSSNCPNGNPNNLKFVWVKACNIAGCSPAKNFP
jgi:YD repeat-containing protein